MGALPQFTMDYPQGHTEFRMESQDKNPDWMRIGVGASLLTGAILLLTGKRKPGLLATGLGTALAMVDNKEIVAEWWEALPRQLDKAQRMLDQTQQTIGDITEKRDQVMSLFNR
jgi:hypothetical protein